jgi:hypothetical protein
MKKYHSYFVDGKEAKLLQGISARIWNSIGG